VECLRANEKRVVHVFPESSEPAALASKTSGGTQSQTAQQRERDALVASLAEGLKMSKAYLASHRLVEGDYESQSSMRLLWYTSDTFAALLQTDPHFNEYPSESLKQTQAQKRRLADMAIDTRGDQPHEQAVVENALSKPKTQPGMVKHQADHTDENRFKSKRTNASQVIVVADIVVLHLCCVPSHNLVLTILTRVACTCYLFAVF
jgi:hypothetical protein